MTVPKSTWCDKMSAIAAAVSAAVDLVDYIQTNPHEGRVERGFDNIVKALAVINRNISRSLVSVDCLSSLENIELDSVYAYAPSGEKIVLEGLTLGHTSNFDLTQENLKKVSIALTKMMSKTVSDPSDLKFETTQQYQKNADNLQTLIFSASIGEMKVDLTDLIKQFKMNIGETEYTFAQVLYNLLKVSQDANFKPDNLPESLLAVAAETKDLQVRLVGV